MNGSVQQPRHHLSDLTLRRTAPSGKEQPSLRREDDDHCDPPSLRPRPQAPRLDPASRRRSVGVGGRQTRGTAKGSGQHVLRKFAARSLGRCPLVARGGGGGGGVASS